MDRATDALRIGNARRSAAVSAAAIVKRIEIGNVSAINEIIVIAMANAAVAHATNVPAMTDVAEAVAVDVMIAIAIVIVIGVRAKGIEAARACSGIASVNAADLVTSVVAVARVTCSASA